MMMNAGVAHAMESLFGPASQKVDLSSFLKVSSGLPQPNHEQEVFPDHIAEECSVLELKTLLNDTWSNPTLSAYLIHDHDDTVSALRSLYLTPDQKPQKSNRKGHSCDLNKWPAEVTNLRKNLDAVSLNGFGLRAEAAHFVRTSKNSDKNILQSPVRRSVSVLTNGQPEAIITISVYNRLHWGPSYVTRSSQHSFLSSQTLKDVYDVIPCDSKNLPSEAGIAGGMDVCFMCIEDHVYSNGVSEEKLLKFLQSLSKRYQKTITNAACSQRDTKLSGLALRINEPYWLIHHGNCEHFVVVDQIRLLHPSDTRTGYPLTLHIAPSILELCRACSKVPAVLSIVGDVRLGQSPCLLCRPCWKRMGESKDQDIVVLPLVEPSYR